MQLFFLHLKVWRISTIATRAYMITMVEYYTAFHTENILNVLRNRLNIALQ